MGKDGAAWREVLSSRWTVLCLLFLTRLIFGAQFQSLPPVMAHLVAALDLTYAQVGLLIGIFMLPGVVVSLPGGVLARRYGERWMLLGALALMMLGGLLVGFSGSFAVSLGGRLLSGIGAVIALMVTSKVVTDRFVGREIATAMSVLSSGNPLGIGLVLLTLGAVAEAAGWPMAMHGVTAAVGVLLVIVLMFYREAPRQEEGASAGQQHPRGPLPLRAAGLSAAAGLVWTGHIGAWILFVGFVPALLIARGFSIPEAGAVTSVAAWVSIAAMPVGGWVADASRRTNLCIVAGSLLSGVCIALLAYGWPPVLCAALYGAMIGLGAGAIMALPGEVLAPAERATGFGVFYTVNYLGVTLVPPLAGWLRDLSGNPAMPVYLAALLAAATVLALWGFRLVQGRKP